MVATARKAMLEMSKEELAFSKQMSVPIVEFLRNSNQTAMIQFASMASSPHQDAFHHSKTDVIV